MGKVQYRFRRAVLWLVTLLIGKLTLIKTWASAARYESATGFNNAGAAGVVYLPDNDGLGVMAAGKIIPLRIYSHAEGEVPMDVTRVRKMLATRRSRRVG